MNQKADEAIETPPAVAEMLTQGLAVMRLENETQMQMSIQRPRKEEVVINGALKELELCPEFAKTAFYSIPYKDYSGGEEKTIFVEGLSIKSAMALARRWGNNSNGFRVVEDSQERVIVQGVFLDYETGMRTMREVSVSKMQYVKKTKTFVPLRPDRLNMAILAGGSKAVRNAILASLPEGLKSMYFEKAKGIVTKGVGKNADQSKVAKDLVDEYARLGVTGDELKLAMGKSKDSGLDKTDLIRLRGMLTAIQEGTSSVEDFFPKKRAAGPGGAVAEGEVTTGGILGEQGSREPGQDG